MQDREDAIFWERLADMPFEEHEQECVLRREHIVLQLAVLRNARLEAEDRGRKDEAHHLGVALLSTSAQLTLLNERIKYLRRLMHTYSWANAVKAVLGEEAYEQLVVWRVQQEQSHMPVKPPEVQA